MSQSYPPPQPPQGGNPYGQQQPQYGQQPGGVPPQGGNPFGDLHDKTSRVAQLSADPRGYHVFEALNTKPGITYLARVVHEQEA